MCAWVFVCARARVTAVCARVCVLARVPKGKDANGERKTLLYASAYATAQRGVWARLPGGGGWPPSSSCMGARGLVCGFLSAW